MCLTDRFDCRKKSKHLSEKKLSNDALKWTLRTRPMASVPPAPRPAAPEKGLETCVKLDIHTQATEMP